MLIGDLIHWLYLAAVWIMSLSLFCATVLWVTAASWIVIEWSWKRLHALTK